MLHRLLFGASLFLQISSSNINLTCFECHGCLATQKETSIGNRLCFRIEVYCPTVDIHVIDLMGDQRHPNYSSTNCGQTLSYSSTCTIAYHCCFFDRCNAYENSLVPSHSLASFDRIHSDLLINLLWTMTLISSYRYF